MSRDDMVKTLLYFGEDPQTAEVLKDGNAKDAFSKFAHATAAAGT